MSKEQRQVALSQLARLVGGTLEGVDRPISGIAVLSGASTSEISFYADPRYHDEFKATKAGAVFVKPDTKRSDELKHVSFVRVASPHLAFAKVATVFFPAAPIVAGVHPSAVIEVGAEVAPSASLGPHVTVSRGARIGARAQLAAGVFIGVDARVGDDSKLSANVVLGDGCSIGARCIIHSNAVIGADGFGFVFDAAKKEHFKIPQVGTVRIEDDVELGACTCVDRATTGETVIGRGSKIDNLVQVGHNCVIGPLTILCSQVGLSGSTSTGVGVMMAGQSGSAGHLHIGDGARVIGQSGLMADVEPGATIAGSPPVPHREFFKLHAHYARLPEMNKELRELKARLERLEGKTP